MILVLIRSLNQWHDMVISTLLILAETHISLLINLEKVAT